MKRIRLGILVLMVLFSLTACGRNDTDKQLSDEASDSVEHEITSTEESAMETETPIEEKNTFENMVQVQTDTHRGSGILWSTQEESWIFVTAAHVVGEEQEVELYFVPEDKMYIAKVYGVTGLDLAFISLDVDLLTQEVMESYQEVKKSNTLPEIDSTIISMGYNASAEFKSYEGRLAENWIYVEDFDNYMLLAHCEAQAGMSGGGMFNQEGSLQGLICGQDENGTLAGLSTTVIENEYQLFINN